MIGHTGSVSLALFIRAKLSKIVGTVRYVYIFLLLDNSQNLAAHVF